MKKYFILLVAITLTADFDQVSAQDQEVQQLLLNVEKLAQLESILENMKKGYQVLSVGYNTVKDIAEGNFELHDIFMEGLLSVNPAIAKYQRVADIISYQKRLVVEYKRADHRARNNPFFTVSELEYFSRVYANLLRLSLQSLDELLMVTTASKLRMSDDERLKAIDRLFEHTESQLNFLRHFNMGVDILAVQRAKRQHDIESVEQLYQ